MIYTVQSLAHIADQSEVTISNALRRGDLKGEKIDRKWYIDGPDADKYLAVRLFDNLHKGARIW